MSPDSHILDTLQRATSTRNMLSATRNSNGRFAKKTQIPSPRSSPVESISSSFSDYDIPTPDHIDTEIDISDIDSEYHHSASPFGFHTPVHSGIGNFVSLDTPLSSQPSSPPVPHPHLPNTFPTGTDIFTTPFTYPPVPPAPPAPPAPPVPQQRRRMSIQRIEMFFGDGRDSENPQDFIKMLEVSFDHDSSLTPAQKCERFRRHCRSTMDAEEWYDTLDATTIADWDKLKTAFNIQWPPRQRIKPTTAERTKELRNNLLADEDILKRVEKGGITVYGFAAWISEITRMAALCDTGNAHIQSVYETLPKIMRDQVAETTLTDWATFATAVRGVSIAKLRDAIKEETRHKAIEEQLADLARRARVPLATSASAMEELQRALGGLSLGTPITPRPYVMNAPAAHTGGAQRGTRLFASYPNSTTPAAPAPAPAPYIPAPPRAPVLFRPANERLVDLLRTALPQHPDTAAGHAAYVRQIADYATQHGSTKPHETRPYPLKPGTLAVSTGACFKCGTDLPRRHTSRECFSATPVPDAELRYRMVAAVCHGLIRGPQPPEGFVAQAVRMIEVTNLTEAQLADLQAEGAFITEIDQGNGNGLLV
ncbi:hypothetical protein FIBSPDRAFT_952373 [Athelia psychrophila]|uniref:Retrotransposon gag domain-containing protein n=1 Tax=Athelia psychrophila TaxID=1759441 RepID=A0A166LK97_9AGAM|nr:hypothetical protein FIBSPDRAFT_952373 [Fibularhizoctonia sp. CBS 109695]